MLITRTLWATVVLLLKMVWDKLSWRISELHTKLRGCYVTIWLHLCQVMLDQCFTVPADCPLTRHHCAQERCRELETELAELNLEMEELTAALARVEADAAASAEEKARLRSEYETRIRVVVTQMSGLQRQLNGQVNGGKLAEWAFQSRHVAVGRLVEAHAIVVSLPQACVTHASIVVRRQWLPAAAS